MPNMQEELEKAKHLILQKKYGQARELLSQLPDSITAQKWLLKLDEIAPLAKNTLAKNTLVEKQGLEKAKQLIIKKEFEQAREVLSQLSNSAVAKKWLQKLNEIAPVITPRTIIERVDTAISPSQLERATPRSQYTPASKNLSQTPLPSKDRQRNEAFSDVKSSDNRVTSPRNKTKKVKRKKTKPKKTLGRNKKVIMITFGSYLIVTLLYLPVSYGLDMIQGDFKEHFLFVAIQVWVFFGWLGEIILLVRSGWLGATIKWFLRWLFELFFTCNPGMWLAGLVGLALGLSSASFGLWFTFFLAGLMGPIGTIVGILLPQEFIPSSDTLSSDNA